jgi:hypothetical protein
VKLEYVIVHTGWAAPARGGSGDRHHRRRVSSVEY